MKRGCTGSWTPGGISAPGRSGPECGPSFDHGANSARLIDLRIEVRRIRVAKAAYVKVMSTRLGNIVSKLEPRRLSSWPQGKPQAQQAERKVRLQNRTIAMHEVSVSIRIGPSGRLRQCKSAGLRGADELRERAVIQSIFRGRRWATAHTLSFQLGARQISSTARAAFDGSRVSITSSRFPVLRGGKFGSGDTFPVAEHATKNCRAQLYGSDWQVRPFQVCFG